MGSLLKVVRVYGIVQGVGFRPFVSRIADAAGICGTVANKGSYVEIWMQGSPEAETQFLWALENQAPERSAILKIDVREAEGLEGSFDRFEIIESEKETGDIFVSPDIATCPKCKKELFDPANRRYMHPFINCTACGPRLTILDAMPYDRVRTSMGEFPMCPECGYEYTHAETRRYDAQPVCCPACGPVVYVPGTDLKGAEAITYARRAIMEGKIIAVKGIGGFHLCCDARNEAAVARLRVLKHRPVKPFAVMMRDMDTVRRECLLSSFSDEFSDEIEEMLDGHQKPIILLRKHPEGHLAPSVAPGNPKVGIMLPYAPIQMLLFDQDDGLEMTTDCFVMTSGNLSGAPICRTDEDVAEQISSFCDIVLSNNRKIRLRADDSVMDYYRGQPYMIRRSRGFAPLPFMLSEPFAGQVLAIGGELKNTFCIARNQLLYPSSYLGDMADLRTVKALRESVVRMCELLETEPSLVVSDMHPRYNTVMAAEEIARERQIPLVKIQHHYAHILACMAENDFEEPVIGVSFDGTGYGTDGTIWGGELMICDPLSFERVGSIVPFMQVGGDASAREGWRIAASMLSSLYGEKAGEICESLGLCRKSDAALIARMAGRGINSVRSTSAGRLFDSVSAILGICRASTFEGEAATSLQFAAERARERQADAPQMAAPAQGQTWTLMTEGPDLIVIQPDVTKGPDPIVNLRTDLLVRYLTEQRLAGADRDDLALAFHQGLAALITEAVLGLAQERGLGTATLSGGVFQNTLLLGLVEDGLERGGLRVLRHSLVPPNDGGIALGQAFYGIHYLREKADGLSAGNPCP